ncbi:GntR family transcriptional regulator [Bacillus sp. KH172YL63]|uniref:GntR family transcriptional regulator n=1 Tax=Bacillus sp. KH172YL63 TaxID=2709784 RepID=UPI0013E4CC17|nr:GntR family transcriptional regulator [Bacillus sp. KH172YL63]BCB03938.1 GntR family transcriptional regulator [Bacillus sp. KH172YL63]
MIDENNPVPYHLQIKSILRKEIVNGLYKERIPSERDLMDRFSVSRTTIREAVSHLVSDGVLEKIHGKGTFISRKAPVHEWLDSLSSLTDTIRKMGMVPGSKLLQYGMVTDTEGICSMLDTDDIFLIERLRTADTTPIAIERHFYHQEIGMKLTAFNLNDLSIYDLLEKDLGIEIEEAEQFISCKVVSEADAAELAISDGSSVLCVERVMTDAGGKKIEYYTSVFRPDMYVFRIKTKRRK